MTVLTQRIGLRAALLAGAVALTLGVGGWALVRARTPRRQTDIAREFTQGAQWADSVERLLVRQSPAEMTTG